MNVNVDRVLRARDMYGSWGRRVKGAAMSVRVFTPYFDKLLDRLLGKAEISPEAISVVTDLSPGSGTLDYRRQLLGAKALVERDIELRSLPRLHAKVLVCDGVLVTVGSQNFTSYARNSKETTAVPEEDVSGSRFLETLDDWYETATPVSLEFIEGLLDRLDQRMKELRDAERVLAAAFEDEWESYLAELEAERRRQQMAELRPSLARQLATAVERSRRLRRQSQVWAHLQSAGVYGSETLKVSGRGDLTWWPARVIEDDARSSVLLRRLQMYPLILNPSGQMAFARVAQHQISYVRASVGSRIFQPPIGPASYLMTVTFPDNGLEESNVDVRLTVTGEVVYAELRVSLMFGGMRAVLRRAEVAPGKAYSNVGRERRDAQTSDLTSLASWLALPEGTESLIRAAFENFKYQHLGIENVNASRFFPRNWMRISALKFVDRPVLVVTPYEG